MTTRQDAAHGPSPVTTLSPLERRVLAVLPLDGAPPLTLDEIAEHVLRDGGGSVGHDEAAVTVRHLRNQGLVRRFRLPMGVVFVEDGRVMGVSVKPSRIPRMGLASSIDVMVLYWDAEDAAIPRVEIVNRPEGEGSPTWGYYRA